MAYNFLVDQALRNIWGNPSQDEQCIIQPQKITPFGGVWNKVAVGWDVYALPATKTRFHVYQIGQINPLLLGLEPSSDAWISFADGCTAENMLVDIYSATGLQLPRFQTWYRATPDNNLIIAVQDQPKIGITLNTDAIFLRVYSNAYCNMGSGSVLTSAGNTGYLRVTGGVPSTTDELLALQTTYTEWSALSGVAYGFVNGFRVSEISLLTAAVGDVIEFVYDASIYKVVDFDVSGLRTFVSLLDNKMKYLLHYPGTGATEIDYQDDIDVFVMKPVTSTIYQGVYYHKNQPDALRMVTHRDYAIPVPYLAGYAAAQSTWTDITQLRVRLHIRHGGMPQTLLQENNRILELYKMTDDNVRGALLGVNSTVSNWRADTLENSSYTAVMRYANMNLPIALVQDAFGYNAASKLIADTPSATYSVDNVLMADLPYGLTVNSTGYEYDSNGLLLGWNPHLVGTSYFPGYAATKKVEVISGLTSTLLNETYGSSTQTLSKFVDYRMYVCDITNGVPQNNWKDVTGVAGYYTLIGTTLTWAVDSTKILTLVRGNDVNLGYSLTLQPTDGLLKFSLNCQMNRDDAISNYVMQIPLGKLDVFMNGYSLIPGVDYIVNFPQIVIINKQYLNPVSEGQNIAIRMYGHCESTLSIEIPEDTGFVDQGVLSDNNIYDIRDDKVLRIIVGGRLYTRDQLDFAEVMGTVAPIAALNGEPYMVDDILVPMQGIVTEDTNTFRDASKVIDKAVSDYLTLNLPQQTLTATQAIPELYPVISPFICKIIYDLVNGVLTDNRLKAFYNDNVVMEIVAPYLYLLAYDPTQNGLQINSSFVTVEPHNLTTVIDMDIYSFKFIHRVVDLYSNGLVRLANFIRIKEITQAEALGNG